MIIQFAIVLSLLLGFCGLVLDLGTFELKKIQMQNAADAAALGAMHTMEGGAQKSDWQSAGKSDSALNGFTDSSHNITVVVDQPSAGTYASNSSAVQATVTQQVQALFFPGAWTLMAQATALAPPTVPPCMYGRSSASNGLNASNATISMDCSFYLGHSVAISNSNVTNTNTSMPQFYLMTGSQPTPSTISGNTSGSSITPLYNQLSMPDPLSSIVQPTPGNCDSTLASPQPNANNPPNLSPGIYCGQLIIKNIAAPGITMNPGLYTFTHGISITNSTVSGTGVTFFLTQSSGDSWSATQPQSQQFYSSNSTLNFLAPVNDSTGPSGALGIQGILVFADRGWTTGDVAFSLSGATSSTTMDGILYMPHTGISMTNSTVQSTNYFGMVADTISLTNGSIALKSNYATLVSGNPFRAASIGGALVQ